MILNKKLMNYLVLFIGIIFISAALFRIFNYPAGVEVFNNLGISLYLLPVTLAVELIIGTLFLIKRKIDFATKLSILFIVIALTLTIIFNYSSIIQNISELFVLNPTPTDILLHITYIIFLLIILINYKKREK